MRCMQLPASLTVAFCSVSNGSTFVWTPCAKNHWVWVCAGIKLWRYQWDSQTFQRQSDWGSKNQPMGVLELIQVPRGLANCWLWESCRLMVKACCHTHQSLKAGQIDLGHCQEEVKGCGLFQRWCSMWVPEPLQISKSQKALKTTSIDSGSIDLTIDSTR